MNDMDINNPPPKGTPLQMLDEATVLASTNATSTAQQKNWSQPTTNKMQLPK